MIHPAVSAAGPYYATHRVNALWCRNDFIYDDSYGSFQLSSATYSVAESGGTVTVTATRTGGSSGSASMSYWILDGTAIAGRDYDFPPTGSNGWLTWADGDSADKTITIPIIDNTLNELNKTFRVGINTDGLQISVVAGQDPSAKPLFGSPISATVTIIDDDNPPTVQFNAASSSGNESVTPAAITVTLSAASGKTVTVNYATANGTAVAGSDYTTTSGTLTFNPGEISKTINVPIINDTTIESNETFTLSLTNPVNASLGSISTHTYTILNDDNNGVISFSSSTYSVTEGTSTVTITVRRTGTSTGAVGVTYATSNGTAIAGSDYTTKTGTLSWASGDTANKTFTVSITNDSLDEDNETFTVTLSRPTGSAVLGTPSTATVTINDNDNPPVVQFSSSSSSGSESTTTAAITVNLSPVSGRTVTVAYATANGTAIAGSDYTATSGTLTFTPGQTSKTINVPIINDANYEASETFTIRLSNPVNATLGSRTTHTRTITNDDVKPTVQFQTSSSSGSEAVTPAQIVVVLSAASYQTISVSYATSNGTATSGSDYIAASGTLTFNPGVISQTINIPIINDIAVESNETFTVRLTSATNATLGATTIHTRTILNND